MARHVGAPGALLAPALATVVGLCAVGAGVERLMQHGETPAPRTIATRDAGPVAVPLPPTSKVPRAAGSSRPSTASLARPSPPVAISIARLGLRAAITNIGTTGVGTLAVPEDPHKVGWWHRGVAPGHAGPAVLVGHKDSRTGPAVFYGLGDLVVGDEVVVDSADGRSTRFAVTRLQQVRRDDFPTKEVYGPTRVPELRLLTCGGDFDEDAREYEDNLIVYASVRR